MNQTLYWYDYETFGLNPKSDRPAQFAGIRTNLELEEIGEPINIYCKPSPDALPSPQSCLITKITPQFCQANGILEHEFASIIFRQLSEPGTISVGYNNIKFDDEFNRFLFWRNLFDCYAHTWKDECSRWDLTKLVQALYALRPDAIIWPCNDNGVVSTRLEDLCKANNIYHESAHDALSDVRATIALARLIKKVEPSLFDYCLKLRNKTFVLSQFLSRSNKKPEFRPINQRSPILHVSSMFGATRGFLGIVYPLSVHPMNSNEIIVWDLQYDPSILVGLNADHIKARLFTRNEDLPNGIKRLPITTIAINQSPFVIYDRSVLTEERASQLGIDLEQIAKHVEQAKKLQLDISLWQKVYNGNHEIPDVDDHLYKGFISNSDRALLERARQMNGYDLSRHSWSFNDPRLNELVFRYRARNFPDFLTQEESEKWKMVCIEKINNKLPAFNCELETLGSSATSLDAMILDQLQTWVQCHYEKIGIELHDSNQGILKPR